MDNILNNSSTKKSNLIVHIGFGKTSTSKLQADIFPLLCEYTGYNFWGAENGFEKNMPLTDKFINLIARMWLDKPLKKMEFKGNTFISNEGLSSYRDGHHILSYADKNLITFGYDAHIVLVIREPKKWLSSIYMQNCVHENPLQEPETFFLSEQDYSVYLPDPKFNIDRFDYNKIISKYCSLFKKVTIVKFETLPELNFLSDIFELTDEQLNELRRQYKKNNINRALSITSIKVVKIFSKFLMLFKLSYKAKYNNHILLLRSRYDFLNQHTLRIEEVPGITGVIKRFFHIFHYKFLLVKVLDKIVPYKKFSLNFDKLNNIDIKSLESQYQNLPDFITYDKTNNKK